MMKNPKNKKFEKYNFRLYFVHKRACLFNILSTLTIMIDSLKTVQTAKIRNNLKQNKQNKTYTAKNHRTDQLNYR